MDVPLKKEVLYYTNYDLKNVITPVDVNALEKLLIQSEYNQNKTKKIVQGFRYGFDLGYRGPTNVTRTSPNLRLTVGDETDLWNKVMNEVKLKRYAGPYSCENPPYRHYIQSPIGLVPKDGGRNTRLIFHLSYPKGGNTSIDGNTPKEFCTVSYPDFSVAVKQCLREGIGCHLSRSDMSAAFRNLGILRRQWRLLCMKAKSPLDGKWYLFYDKCLPFGSGVSCKIFQEFSDCIAHLVKWKANVGKDVTNYLDDYLFVALLKAICNHQCRTFLEICDLIKFPVALDKTFWGDTRMTFLGFLIDTIAQMVCIPVDKITKGVNLITYLMGKRKATVYQIQQLCGYLNFISRCIVPGRTFTRILYQSLNPALRQHHHLKITQEMKMDMGIWLEFLKTPESFARPFMDFDLVSADELDFYTDATKNPKLGFGGCFNNSYMYCRWNSNFIRQYDPSIAYLELYAVTAAILAWIHRLKNRRVVVFVDNKPVKSMLNFMTSGCKNCMILIRILVLQQMLHNVRIYGKYVTSAANDQADDLSRMRINKFKTEARKRGKILDKIATPVPAEIWPMEKVWLH